MQMIIVLDPGHGGHDPGAVGPTGLREADVVLDVARRARLLFDAGGHDCRLTRDADAYVTLETRADFANRLGADLFVSIHCNAAESRDAHGTETWYYEGSDVGEQIATLTQSHLLQRCGRRDRGIKATRSFSVLRRTRMPAVLVELAFISNRGEEYRLRHEGFRSLAAVAVYDAVNEWAEVSAV